MIDQIVDHLFLGCNDGAINSSMIADLNITHILSTMGGPIREEQKVENVVYHFVHVNDVENQDILSVLDEGLQFIEKAVSSGGNCLVHCVAGMSRSASFVIAYVMRKYQWSLDKSLGFVKARRPGIYPNEGFIQQLLIFETIGWNADIEALKSSDPYRKWIVSSGNCPTSGKDENSLILLRDIKDSGPTDRNFRCMKCRHELFSSSHLNKHLRIDGKECPFAFLIDPLNWMDLNEYEGKINCPNCGDKLGNYCWGGRQCKEDDKGATRCRKQIQPWVHMSKDKIREVRPVAKAFLPSPIIEAIPSKNN